MIPACWAVLLTLATGEAGQPLTLEDAVALARERAKDAIHAKEDVLMVDVEHLAAVSAILPRLDLTLSAAEQFAGDPIVESRMPTGTIDPLTGQLTGVRYGPFRDAEVGSYSNPQLVLELRGRQLIFDGGRWWTAIARVGDVERSRKALEKAVENDLCARVAERFYGVEKARQAVLAFQEQLAVGEAQLARQRALLSAGRGKPSDVAAAVRNVAEDRMTLAQRTFTAAQAARALNLELGRDAATPVSLSIPREITTATSAHAAPPAPALEVLERAALEERPELISLRADLAAAEKSVAIERAAYWPTLSLGASYRRMSRRPDRVFNNPFENYFAGLDLSMQWNLFEGRATDAKVQVEEIRRRKLEASFDDLVRRVLGEVQDKLQALFLAEETHRLALETMSAAWEAVRLARGLQEQGLGTELERRDAEQKYTQAKLSAITARLEIEVASEALRRAVGGDLPR